MEDWFQLVISCYPLTEGLKPERDITPVEKALVLELLRKQRQQSYAANKLPVVQMLLSKLIVVSVGYCSDEFDEDDWDFVLYRLRWWIESTVVMMEEVAENVNDAITNSSTSDDIEVTLEKLEHSVSVLNPNPIILAKNALVAFSLFCKLIGQQKIGDSDSSTNPLRTEKWEVVKDRILEGILRLFFSTGAAEAIASSVCAEGSSLIASTRLDHPHFWELVASNVVDSSPHARDKAVKSVEMWGLSKGPISSLYAILFSSKPVSCMQFAAFVILSSEPVSQSAFVKEETCILEGNTAEDQDSSRLDSSLEDNVCLRSEISSMLVKSPYEILQMDLVAPYRVSI